MGAKVGSLKRVVIVGPKPPPLGGMAVQGRLLQQRLGAEGLSVRFLATNPRLPRVLRFPGVRTIASLLVYLSRLLSSGRKGEVVHILAASGLFFHLRVAPAVLWNRFRGRRVILNYRGGLAATFFKAQWRLVAPILHRVQVVTVPSAFLKRVFAEFGVEAQVVSNVMELERFPFRQRRMGPELKILVNRSLEKIYNIPLAIEAFRVFRETHPGASLTLAGGGSLRGEVEALVEREGIEGVTFLGRVDHEAMPALLDQHDVSLNPTDVDNMPVSILEAFASGLPVVSTDAGGVPDLVEDGVHGLLVPKGNAPAIVQALERLVSEEGLAERLVAAGRAHGEGFRWEMVFPQLLAVYGFGSPQDSE